MALWPRSRQRRWSPGLLTTRVSTSAADEKVQVRQARRVAEIPEHARARAATRRLCRCAWNGNVGVPPATTRGTGSPSARSSRAASATAQRPRRTAVAHREVGIVDVAVISVQAAGRTARQRRDAAIQAPPPPRPARRRSDACRSRDRARPPALSPALVSRLRYPQRRPLVVRDRGEATSRKLRASSTEPTDVRTDRLIGQQHVRGAARARSSRLRRSSRT